MPKNTGLAEPSPAITSVGYCTNVHPGSELLATRANLERFALGVKSRVSPHSPMGVGLWLSANSADQLLEQELLDPFADWLAEVGLVPFTLNGFPYGDFHEDVVKHQVYLPTWNDPERLRYTRSLIRILDRLLPQGREGSISTLPLEWGNPLPGAERQAEAARHLREIAEDLRRLEQQHGRLITLCIEPEPGCVIQRSGDLVRFFEDHLLPGQDESLVRRYLRVCHDVCHSAVMFQTQAEVFDEYRAAGIEVGKIQASSAIVVPLDEIDPEDRARAFGDLRRFAEDRYLHQTTVRLTPDQPPAFFEDLPQALRLVDDPRQLTGQWRVHFHVPIHVERLGLLHTSRQDILDCLRAAPALSTAAHMEVETYAWDVLPPDLQRASVVDGIADELQWLHGQIDAVRCLPATG